MADVDDRSPSVAARIADRAREREIRRQIRFAATWRFVGRHRSIARSFAPGPSDLRREFLKMLLAAMLGMWVIATLLSTFLGPTPIYALAIIGLLYSTQIAYYEYRLRRDPAYTIADCGCGGREYDDTEVVLGAKAGKTLGVPNSIAGVAYYSTLAVLVHERYVNAEILLAVGAVMVSAYLGYVMVSKIAALCPTCISIAAVNMLILWELAR